MSVHTPPPPAERKPVTLPRLLEMHAQGEPIAMLTCYDASFAALLDECGVDVLLVGDSLGMVIQGERSTLPVTIEHVAYHTKCVAQTARRAWLIADMPFGSYQASPLAAYDNAARLMAAGAQMVKLEGGAWLAPTVRRMTTRGIPVCAHLGLTPQSIHALGGYRVQGRTDEAAAQLKRDALALQEAGATMLVLELVPAALAAEVTRSLAIPTIGIGAGVDCSGQVLVLHDMLDVYPGRRPRFVRNFMDGAPGIRAAVEAYVAAVKARTFPGPEHSY
ncbi:3-methyl-2-oxobutanoate hydroxymethyltransferase [Betaproteobacteria bacterium PRO7]|jgi:3-methyl-2-oxobutanoate hydroxymethyltransferase|nr:3-methyl-2-oxobutanoate hydroxymethyltransferase [Betaproteobacteria bacterium PRO7]